MPRPKDAPRFTGFGVPRYTPMPDVLVDELMPDLSRSELLVLLYIIRRTYGFKKDSDNISVGQLMHGITTKDGRQLDRGTGLGRSTVLAAVASLEEWGIIERIENTDATRGDQPSTYRLYLGSEELDTPRPEIRTPHAQESGPPRSSAPDPQETDPTKNSQQTGQLHSIDRLRNAVGTRGLGRR